MSAAKQQVARLLQLVPMPARTGNKALARLMAVYAKRADLQEVFPEAADGNLDRLINWAAGVSTRQWVDGSFAELVPSALWYCAKRKRTQEVSEPSPWKDVEQTCAATANPLNVTLSVAQEHRASDISHHLFTMALIVNEFKLKNIVELGTRDGNSTLALLEAARSIGGRVLSVDLQSCDDAKSRIRSAGLHDIWSFMQADSLKLAESSLPEHIDLLFIDTSHMYVQTLAELRKYRARMKEGSWILLHDYVEYPGVRRAVHEFVTELAKKPSFYPFVHQNGLAVIRL